MAVNQHNSLTPADLGRLMSRFLADRAAAWQSGTAVESQTDAGDVTLHQQATLFALDPKTAFAGATEAASLFLTETEADKFQLQPPTEWAAAVRNQETLFAVPFCLGNYPQMLNDVTPLVTAMGLNALRPKARSQPSWSGRETCPQQESADNAETALLQAATARMSGRFEEARSMLSSARQDASASWEGLILNEEAALAWQSGSFAEAESLWAKHPDQNSPAILFNRGMAALFADRQAEARKFLAKAADTLPESSGWHALVQMYLTLA